MVLTEWCCDGGDDGYGYDGGDCEDDDRGLVAEAPWSVAEWAVALRFDNPRATVLDSVSAVVK